MGSLLSLAPLKVPSSCHFWTFFSATVASGLLITDKNIQL